MAERDDNRAAIRDFLSSRRAKISPEQVGLPAGGGTRRVPGLRREEVAVLAGVSTDWYIRLEKGHIAGVSDDVLDAVARALQLDDAEREHLFNLARAARPTRTPRRRPQPRPRPSLQRVLDSMTGVAAFIRNARLDFGRDPDDRALSDLIGELATRSDAFRTRWGSHNVRLHRGGLKRFQHPLVGQLDLDYDSMDLPSAPGLTLTVYSAEPGSPSADALALLASWNTPNDQEHLWNSPDPA